MGYDDVAGLGVLFNEPEISHGDYGETIFVNFPGVPTIDLKIPDVDAKNVSLFAHHIWKSSILLSKLILDHEEFEGLHILELGAGAGLPSIIAARKGGKVTSSDYPDSELINMLKLNLHKHTGQSSDVFGHVWGERGDDGLFPTGEPIKQFDVIVMADTLWMSDQQHNLLKDLKQLLKPTGKVIGCAGLHSGLEVFEAFFKKATSPEYSFLCKLCKPYRIPQAGGMCENEEWKELTGGEVVSDEIRERQWFVYRYELTLSD
ncbi:hypothetical protein HDV02_001502 [Globomyces sp. JEL0801]|nr:hypothetical protein HDV02_001502 [Globomyces sp. JEL0801]